MTKPSLEEYLARVPSDVEGIRDSVDALRGLTVDERLRALDRWVEEILAIQGNRRPSPEPGHPFWRHWRDPSLGRPS